MSHKATHNPGGATFADAFAALIEAFRAELATFKAELLELFQNGGEEPGTPVPPVVQPPPAEEPEEPEVPVVQPPPAEEPDDGLPTEAVRREGTVGYDRFEGEDAAEIFVVNGGDDVVRFDPAADKVEVDAAALGASGEALVDYATAVENGDLRLATTEGGGTAALLFLEDGVVVVEPVSALSEDNWIFA